MQRGIVGADWGSNVAGAGIVVAGKGEKVGTDVRDAAGGRHDKLGAEDSEVPLGSARIGGEMTDINSRFHIEAMCVFMPCVDCRGLRHQHLVGVGKCHRQRVGFGGSCWHRGQAMRCAASRGGLKRCHPYKVGLRNAASKGQA